MRVPRSQLGPLDIHGKDAQVTVIAITDDCQSSRVYVDGKLDASEHTNPFRYSKGMFEGGSDGADLTVGANHVAGIENNNRFGGL